MEITSPSGGFLTNETLFCNATLINTNQTIVQWIKNNQSYTQLHLPFEINSTTLAHDYSTYQTDAVLATGDPSLTTNAIDGFYAYALMERIH